MNDDRNDVTPRPFRFSVGIGGGDSRAEWRKKARQAEDLGYDVITVPDHLGMISPFPALITMAEATNRVHVGTMVLDGAFYRSAWLARDVASVAQLTDGRFELGLGAGPDFAKPEFEALGLPFPSGRQRIEHLRELIVETKALFAGDHQPPVHHHIPLLVAGGGDRLLRVAAEHADTVSLAGISVDADIDSDEIGDAALGRRSQFVREAAGTRFAAIELGLTVQAVEVEGHGEVDLTLPRMFQPHLSDTQLRHLPGFLHGSARTIADTLRRYRDEYSVTHFSVNEAQMTALAKVIEDLR
ncbi:TIGR03621 family F420-dependent LLM class oxidoreductase [Nocardia sp. CDC160]|uniref:TIGR03621 family F420-dependent LLM class oxidoreductase n=1 Tax=Nocardia sp. CDC160 TaxID=3112166 RepID=UPI002DBB33D1|nr:TIGR03621 family F420-dependent LLM class oxidoreductase [Nocardia sp. CDC160]MEC3917694.1 TIGR03621 family F420-dependent LLM class oxidoreductase [Nocardia sp. CDC160]